MEPLEIPGMTRDMALRLAPADGKLLMTVLHRHTGGRASVVLERAWLRPLAAWLAGEAGPGIVGHDEYCTPYGRWLSIEGDETAVAYGTRTWARLRCNLPFGTASVSVCPRRRSDGYTVLLSPEARREVAAHLRRIDAHGWTRPKTVA